MIGNKEIPQLDQLKHFGHAVAGHAGTMSDDSGELFIKPCTQQEVDFYQSANRRHPEFADLMPLFMGTLQLSDPTDKAVPQAVAGVISETGGIEVSQEQIAAVVQEQLSKVNGSSAAEPEKEQGTSQQDWAPKAKSNKIETHQAIVLENTSHGFKQPNILDVKLGIRLWADDAPVAKKQRFDKISSETTHGKLGFRIAGMRVYHGSDDEAAVDEDGYKVYDKDYGRTDVTSDNVVDAFRKFLHVESAGVDRDLCAAVCAAFLSDLRNVQDILSRHESRMYSASLLFAFEGDGPTLKAAIDANNNVVDFVKAVKIERTTKRVDSGIAMEEDDDEEALEALEEELVDMSSLPRIYTLKLIDFAHATWTPGQGPDENTLVGVRSLIRIFEELAQQ